MTEYLVRHHGKWHIATPGAIKHVPQVCIDCAGSGWRGHAQGGDTCGECSGSGKIDKNRIVLAWFDRDTEGLICFSDEEDDVCELD